MRNTKGCNISLYPNEWNEVHKVQEEQKLTSRSAAVRFILWQWLEGKGDQQQLKMENGK